MKEDELKRFQLDERYIRDQARKEKHDHHNRAMHDKTPPARQVLLKEKLKQEHLRARSQSPPPDAREVVRVVLSPPPPQQPPQVQQVQQVQHLQQLQHPQQLQQQHYRTIVSHMAEWVQWTRRYVKSVFMIHVGGTRDVTSSTDNIMNIHARITLTVEFIRGYIFIFFLYV
jgi:hypothetical protein